MKIFLFILIILCVVVNAFASQHNFPEYNCSINVPVGWAPFSVAAPDIVGAFQNSDQSKLILLFAAKPSRDEKRTAIRDLRAGAKDSMIEMGWELEPEKKITIGGLPFRALIGKMRSGSMTVYTTNAGDIVYMIQSLSKVGNGNADPELKSVVESFRLLNPVAAENGPRDARSTAYHAGRLTMKLLAWKA